MTERERLIELLEQAKEKATYTIGSLNNGFGAWYADYLLANGVIVPMCRVGDTVYRIWSVGKHGKSIADFVVTKVAQITERSWVVGYQKRAKNLYSTPTRYQCDFDEIGKTVFTSREEAEKALAEKQGKDEGK